MENERLGTNCRQHADKSYILDGTAIVSLPEGCSAHTRNINIYAIRSVMFNFTMYPIRNCESNINDIMNKFCDEQGPTLRKILSDTSTITTQAQSGMNTEVLRTRVELHEIAAKARQLSAYMDKSDDMELLKSSFAILTSTIIMIIIDIILHLKFRGNQANSNPIIINPLMNMMYQRPTQQSRLSVTSSLSDATSFKDNFVYAQAPSSLYS